MPCCPVQANSVKRIKISKQKQAKKARTKRREKTETKKQKNARKDATKSKASKTTAKQKQQIIKKNIKKQTKPKLFLYVFAGVMFFVLGGFVLLLFLLCFVFLRFVCWRCVYSKLVIFFCCLLLFCYLLFQLFFCISKQNWFSLYRRRHHPDAEKTLGRFGGRGYLSAMLPGIVAWIHQGKDALLKHVQC